MNVENRLSFRHFSKNKRRNAISIIRNYAIYDFSCGDFYNFNELSGI